ncbi:type IV secretory system conjugative DNA transfer family protein [Actinomadura nitritigenes]|uniref:type IV secretory system conjugative DNA transfer family protein n=1 Tax=Actinomadura nitritigenes TaxID=134602 RepID=UPI003D92E5A8
MAGNDDDDVYTLFFGIGLLVALLGGAGSFLTWLAGQLSGVIAGGGWPDSDPTDCLRIAFRFVTHPSDPRSAWPPAAAAALGSGPVFFSLLAVFLTVAAVGTYFAVRLFLNFRRRRTVRRFRLGYASGWEVRKLLSARTVQNKAWQARPSTHGQNVRTIKPEEVGFYIGRDIRSRRKLYASIEDMAIIISAPRQGKDVHFVTPFTIDAPGPVIVTSSRRETFVNTAMVRAQYGEVYVFDPWNWTGWPNRMRWSPLQGCEDPNVCAVRSGTLVEASGFSIGREGGIVLSGVITIIRCLLHAGAIGRVSFREVMRWIYEANGEEPLEILRQGEREGRTAPGYTGQLEFNMRDERLWSGVMQVMHAFSHPLVLEDCSPEPGEEFDFAKFLKGRNTLYFVAKRQPDWGGIAPVVTTILEQYFRSARGVAMKNPTGRLDPPLTFELNQVADVFVSGGLPTYMGESGGYSISVHVYLTSLAEARAKWGADRTAALLDNATMKIISGGAGTIKDISDLSDLVGKHEGKQILTPEELRTMRFGRAVVVAGTARPVEMWLTPWWKRKDREAIVRSKEAVEAMIRQKDSPPPYAPPPAGPAPAALPPHDPPPDASPTDTRPTDDPPPRPTDTRPTDDPPPRPADTWSNDTRPSDARPSDDTSADERAADRRATTRTAGNERATTRTATGERAADERVTARTVADRRAADGSADAGAVSAPAASGTGDDDDDSSIVW